MKLSEIVSAAFSGKLTCSQVMDVLMDQPTKPVGRNIESHAHMHTMEGFKLKSSGFGGSKFSFERKQLHWENPTHLYPVGEDYGRYVYASGTSGRSYGVYGGVFQDPDRLPPNRSYADRTGLGALTKIETKSFEVWKYPEDQMGAPQLIIIKNLDESEVQQLKPVGRQKGHYMPQKGNTGPIKYRVVLNVDTPAVDESPAHSMFPDAESLVMHLTAALLSDAGKMVLRHLFWNLSPGEQKTVGIFSKTAVRVVTSADLNQPNLMIERTLEVDLNKPRDKVTGRYPATGKIKVIQSAIDHVVAVLGYRKTGELNVLTCFPSRVTTEASIGTKTTGQEDIAELAFGSHTKVKQSNGDPKLRW